MGVSIINSKYFIWHKVWENIQYVITYSYLSIDIFILEWLIPAYLLKHEMTWNDLKQPETTYKEQETTWNDLQWARNDLTQPTTSKKWLDTIYNKQEMTWDNLQQARNNMNKKRHETT